MNIIIFQPTWNLVLIVKNEYEGQYWKYNLNGSPVDYTNHYAILKSVHNNLNKLKFINDAALFPYTENVALTNIYNIYLLIQQLLARMLPFLFENKFTRLRKNHIYLKIAEQEHVCSDEAIHAATHKRLVVVNLMKQNDMEAWKEYENTMSKYLSQVGTKVISMGDADSFYWTQVSLMSYTSRTKFCEMIMSKEVITDALPLRYKGLNDSQTYITFQIMECSEIFRGCRPVDGYRTL